MYSAKVWLAAALALAACEQEATKPGGAGGAGGGGEVPYDAGLADAGGGGFGGGFEGGAGGAGGGAGGGGAGGVGGQGGAGGAGGVGGDDPEQPPPGTLIENAWVDTATDPMSTFSIDPDTASYTRARQALLGGALPDPASVRVEEFVNFFRYDLPVPAAEDPVPFRVDLEAAPSPFGAEAGAPPRHLLRVGLRGRLPELRQRANLVFLVDVSGSMQEEIPLIQYTLQQLTNALHPEDTVAIVTYAGEERVLLEPTPVGQRAEVLTAIDEFQAGGGTAGAAGIRTAYQLATAHFQPGGTNRVVLCTDGDFNIGLTGSELVDEVAVRASEGIGLTVLGFGSFGGGFNDGFLEELTNEGEGRYVFIDSENAALRAIGTDLVSGLDVIAKDVKIQVQFDPAEVSRFRLVGYENRVLAHEDFVDDTVDAGEIGAGHFVTAFYELELRADAGPEDAPPRGGAAPGGSGAGPGEPGAGGEGGVPAPGGADGGADAPQPADAEVPADAGVPADAEVPADAGPPEPPVDAPLATVRLRFKAPAGGASTEVSFVMEGAGVRGAIEEASNDFRFAAAVVEFAEILRHSMHSHGADFAGVEALAEGALAGADADRLELLDLIRAAAGLWQ